MIDTVLHYVQAVELMLLIAIPSLGGCDDCKLKPLIKVLSVN